jgi:hypothetical protein
MTNAYTDAENAGQIIRRRGSPKGRGGWRKSRVRERATQKDVKNEDRSGNVYENKGQDDNLPDTKDDISARLHAILHGNTRILQKPSALLSQFERWERTQRSQM